MEQLNRKLIVPTAQGYYESALGLNTDGEVYSPGEKMCCMEQALNYTKNALHKACCLLEEFLIWEHEDDDNEFDPTLKKKVNKFLEDMKYRQE
jgi:hypothetical protein